MVDTPVRKYIESYRESLLAERARAAETSVHGGDLGENYESLVVRFLNNVMPRRLHAARGGQVLGVEQPPSKQIDVLVTHDSSMEFRADAKSYRVAEGVVAAVAVKSTLNTNEVEEDCKNLASLPTLSESAIATATVPLEALFGQYSARFPKRIIWGWDGLTKKNLQDALVVATRSIAEEKRPDLVLVLSRGVALKRDGNRWPAWDESGDPAAGLGEIVNMMAAAAGWAAQFSVRLSPYW